MDIFFISYKEFNQEKNWLRVLELHPNSHRLHGIKGIDKVHLLCNQISNSPYFWTIDGDNYLLEKLEYKKDFDVDLIMFHALDPLTKLPTGLGGVKLWRKNSIINPNMNKGDFSLNATKNKKVITDQILSITQYNCSPFDAWKTSFRHCVKLMSDIFRSRPNAKNIETYLTHWESSKKLNECFL